MASIKRRRPYYIPRPRGHVHAGTRSNKAIGEAQLAWHAEAQRMRYAFEKWASRHGAMPPESIAVCAPLPRFAVSRRWPRRVRA